MSDARIRELERLAAQGDPGAAASLLAERLRSGDLPLDDLRLAAYLGHPPAVAALGEEAPSQPDHVEGWVQGLAPWGERAVVQAALAAAFAGQAAVSAAPGIPNLGRLLREGTRMISVVERWLVEGRDQAVFLPVFARTPTPSFVEERYRRLITSLGSVAQDLAPWQRAHHASLCGGAAAELAGPAPVWTGVRRALLPRSVGGPWGEAVARDQ